MLLLHENTICSKKPRKKGKFAIAINEQGRSKYYIRKLKYYIQDNFPFLVEECAFTREKSLRAVKAGDYVVFGAGKRKYDYRALSAISFNEDARISDKILIIDLESGFKLVKKAINRYVEKNYPWKVPAKTKVSCCKVPVVEKKVFVSTRPIVSCPFTTPTVTPRPVRVYRSPRPEREWDMQVNNTYVLLTNGNRYETRKITRSGGRETVSIDGTRYTIKRDSYGKGIVV